jgi:N utilization substance protein B
VVVRNILRLAVAEMLILRLNPVAVVINEAVELTRAFMDEESVAFVNSVLEKCRLADEAQGGKEHKKQEQGSKKQNNNA